MSIDTPTSNDMSPFVVKQVQRDAPFKSSDMVSMMRKTASLATGQSGNSITLMFHDIEESPRCAYVTGNRKFEIISDATFDGVPGAIYSTEFRVPWRVHEGYTGVSARILAKTNINTPVSVRLTIGDLIDSTTAKTGSPCPPVLPQSNEFPTLYDTTGERQWTLFRSVAFDCHVPVDVATSPECTIGFELMPSLYSGRESSYSHRRSRNIYMAFQSVTIFDRKYDRG